MKPDEPSVDSNLAAEGHPVWGSDLLAAVLRELSIDYVALTPGASIRGLHDSIVNFLGNRDPSLLLCLHEEHAVGLAHGFAKATGRPMAVALHSNVGLLNGSMAIVNAWCDRMPMLILTGNGPVDATRRRSWIDWMHTVSDPAAAIRPYIKWDDQPGSAEAAAASLVSAYRYSTTRPMAPVLVSLDATVQETECGPCAVPDVALFRAPTPPAPSAQLVDEICQILDRSTAPIILMGRVGRSDAEWSRRVLLAENLNARVVTDQKVAASFPTDHALHAGMSEVLPGSGIQDVLRAADVLLSLDWVDLGGTLNSVRQGAPESAGQTVISCSLDPMLHKGAIKDHFEPAPVNINVLADPDLLVSALLERRHGDATPPRCEDPPLPRKATTTPTGERSRSETNLSLTDIAEALDDLLVGHSHSLVRLPLRWPSSDIHVSAPLDNLGGDGGGGIGAGPSMAIGSSLGLLRTDRLPVAVLGDGDFLMGATALWTAAHYGIPLLVVVANNRSFFNDERHQELVAQSRGRPVENRWLGQHIRDPDPDISGLARSLGADGYGPITSAAELREAFKHGIDRVTAGGVVVIDARIMGA